MNFRRSLGTPWNDEDPVVKRSTPPKVSRVTFQVRFLLFHFCDFPFGHVFKCFAERELRATVTARKVSFGSQSYAGAKTRETLMSLIHTLQKRMADPEVHLKLVLDQLALPSHPRPAQLTVSS